MIRLFSKSYHAIHCLRMNNWAGWSPVVGMLAYRAPTMVIQTRNPSLWEAEAGGTGVRGQTGIHETLSQKQTITKKVNVYSQNIFFWIDIRRAGVLVTIRSHSLSLQSLAGWSGCRMQTAASMGLCEYNKNMCCSRASSLDRLQNGREKVPILL